MRRVLSAPSVPLEDSRSGQPSHFSSSIFEIALQSALPTEQPPVTSWPHLEPLTPGATFPENNTLGSEALGPGVAPDNDHADFHHEIKNPYPDCFVGLKAPASSRLDDKQELSNLLTGNSGPPGGRIVSRSRSPDLQHDLDVRVERPATSFSRLGYSHSSLPNLHSRRVVNATLSNQRSPVLTNPHKLSDNLDGSRPEHGFPQCSGATEVYAVVRPLRELGGPLVHSLPQATKDLMKDVGICHYLTVFKDPSGKLLQFDFGPEAGRDIEAPHPVSRLRRTVGIGATAAENKAKRGVIREEQVRSLLSGLVINRRPTSWMRQGVDKLTMD